MKYHFILSCFQGDYEKQIKEQRCFQEEFLGEIEEGETFILGPNEETCLKTPFCHTKNAVLIMAEEFTPENFLKTLTPLINEEDLYIFSGDYAGNELAVRLASRCNGSSINGVHGLEVKNNITAKKMIYSNHLEGVFELKKAPYFVSLARGLRKCTPPCGTFFVEKRIQCEGAASHIIKSEYEEVFKDEGLEDAKVLVVGGRGIGNKDNEKLLENVAKAIHGQVGLSRAAVMNAFGKMDKLVGVSGIITSPKICIAAGISGAAAFYGGIKKSEFIVAINTDENAPIMKMADVVIVDDFKAIFENLLNILEEREEK